MAKEYPYFKWFPKDAEADEKYSAMDDAELGFFHRCLNKSWMNEGLPADPEERARVLKTPIELANERWRRIGRSFVVSGMFPGKVVNPRQEIERASAITKTVNSRKAANKRHHPQDEKVPASPYSPAVNINEHKNGNSAGNGIQNNALPSWMLDETYIPFVDLARVFWPRLLPEEISQGHHWHWGKLSIEERLAATRNLRLRVDAREDGEFVKHMPDYLKTEWKRGPKKSNGAAETRDQKIHRELMED